MAGKERSDGIQIFVAEKRVDSVVGSKGTVQLKTVLDNGLLNVLMAYAPHSGKLQEEKREQLERTVQFGKLYTLCWLGS